MNGFAPLSPLGALNRRRFVASGEFSPLDLSPILWLDKNAGVEKFGGGPAANNDEIQYWRDQSGNNNDGTSSGGTYQNANGLWQFSGNGFATPITTALGDFTCFVVWQDIATDAVGRLVDKTFDNGFWLGRSNAGGNSWGGGVKDTSSPFGRYISLNASTPTLISSRRSGMTHTVRSGSVTTSDTVAGSATSTAALQIGSAVGGGSVANVYHKEILLFDYALSDAEITQVETYLAAKHSITLP